MNTPDNEAFVDPDDPDFDWAAFAEASTSVGDNSTTPETEEGDDDDDDTSNEDPKYSLDDEGNIERFLDSYRARVLYDSERGNWYLWDGARYVRYGKSKSNDDPVKGMMREAVKVLMTEAANTKKRRQREAIKSFYKQCRNTARIASSVSLLKTDTRIQARDADFDDRGTDYLLNVKNGTVDLRTNTFRPHDPADMITRVANVKYDPDADCPVFKQYLSEVMGEREDVIEYVQRAIGMTLTGDVKSKAIFILYGDTHTGKSTFIDTFYRMLAGDDPMSPEYAWAIKPQTLMASRDSSATRFELSGLQGKRLVVSAETEEGRRLDENTIKLLTGGDIINIEEKGKQPTNMRQTHKLWFSTNHLPRIVSTSDAIWDRVKIIPFEYKFYMPGTTPEGLESREADLDLANKIWAEASGILNWAIEGCIKWLQDGKRLVMPESMNHLIAEYRVNQDTIGQFIEDYCVVGEDQKVSLADLFNAYRTWCAAENTIPKKRGNFIDSLLTRSELRGKLEKKKMKFSTVGSAWGISGIGLNEDGQTQGAGGFFKNHIQGPEPY